jgi:hypothetical protein
MMRDDAVLFRGPHRDETTARQRQHSDKMNANAGSILYDNNDET